MSDPKRYRGWLVVENTERLIEPPSPPPGLWRAYQSPGGEWIARQERAWVKGRETVRWGLYRERGTMHTLFGHYGTLRGAMRMAGRPRGPWIGASS